MFFAVISYYGQNTLARYYSEIARASTFWPVLQYIDARTWKEAESKVTVPLYKYKTKYHHRRMGIQ